MCYSWNKPIGITGAIVGSLLTTYAIYKFWVFIDRRSESRDPQVYTKKMAFHILIILAAGLDVPLCISLATICDYNSIAYGFHKLQPPMLFAALSVTVSIWSGVLYDLREFHDWPFFLRRVSLIGVNVVFMVFGFSLFVMCFFYNDMGDIANTELYTLVYWVQIVCSAAVTSVMLHLGVKLKQRIQGAAGPQDSVHSRYSTGSAKPFKVALDRLTRVMGVCLFCVLLQSALLIANFIWSDAHDPDRYVFNPLAYWIFTNWVPQVGWVLALLYLCRTSQSSKKNQTSGSASACATEQYRLKDPLLEVSDADMPRQSSDDLSALDGVFDDSVLMTDVEDLMSENSRMYSRDLNTSDITDC